MRISDLRLLTVVCATQVMLAAAVRIARVGAVRAATCRCRTLAQRATGANAERTAWAIEAVGRRLPRISTCLTRALAADLLLSTDVAPGHIRIGVRRARSGALESHAWFEHDGRILVGAVGAGDYVHLVNLPGRS